MHVVKPDSLVVCLGSLCLNWLKELLFIFTRNNEDASENPQELVEIIALNYMSTILEFELYLFTTEVFSSYRKNVLGTSNRYLPVLG